MKSISRSGEVIISFSNDMIVPKIPEPSSSDTNRILDSSNEDISIETVIKNEGMLSAELISDSNNDSGDKAGIFNWHISEYTEKSMRV